MTDKNNKGNNTKVEKNSNENKSKSNNKDNTNHKDNKNNNNNNSQYSKPQLYHWADVAADGIIKRRGDKKSYTIAAGITPSGFIHLGNFREVITEDLIKRALESRGKNVRFIYSWDDYDVFRKVPKNMPNPEELEKYLRLPIFRIPDPFGEYGSYAEHFEKVFEKEITPLGINPEYLYQHKLYSDCTYADGIKKAIENEEVIREILNEFRKEPLEENWNPYFVFCEKCNTDKIKEMDYKGDYNIYYKCQCGHEDTIDFRKKGIVTLRWRIDWPMRWDYYDEDFEAAGKDHFAAGGSVTTGRKIQEQVYGSKHPNGFVYEWIAIKGGGEFSSSAGKVITVSEALEVYEPEVLRFLFAGTKPNVTFNISFDLDVIKIYEDFDKCERIYYKEEKVNEKEFLKQSRIYELSCVEKPQTKIPYQPSFRHLTLILQINEFDIEKTISYYEEQLTNEHDKKRLRNRADCAKNWILKYAPEDFKFHVQNKVSEDAKKLIPDEYKKLFSDVSKLLLEKNWNDRELHEEFYVLVKSHNLEHRDFFKYSYLILINKEKGPQLANFILTIGKDRASKLFSEI